MMSCLICASVFPLTGRSHDKSWSASSSARPRDDRQRIVFVCLFLDEHLRGTRQTAPTTSAKINASSDQHGASTRCAPLGRWVPWFGFTHGSSLLVGPRRARRGYIAGWCSTRRTEGIRIDLRRWRSRPVARYRDARIAQCGAATHWYRGCA